MTGCGCGGTVGGPNTGPIVKEIPCWPGADAEIRLEYVGDEKRIVRLGVVSGTVYVFGVDDRVKRVDVWDMPRLVKDQEIRRIE